MQLKKIYKHCSLFIIFAFLLIIIVPSQNLKAAEPESQKHSSLNFAILDHDHIMQNSMAAQQARQDLEQKRMAFQTELDSHERALREAEKKLIELQTRSSEEQYLKEKQDFDTRVAETHKIVAERRTQLNESYDRVLESINKATLTIVKDIAEYEGYQVVFPRSIIFYCSVKAVDITNPVLNKLDKILPEVSLVDRGNITSEVKPNR